MRFNLTALGLLLPVAAVLSGCGMGSMSNSVATGSNSTTGSAKMIKGKAFGGQQPVTGSVIALYAFGSSGYGSAGQLLAQTTTDATGYFNVDPNSIHCPTPDTPVYLLSIGGDPGFGTNPAILLGSAVGPCSGAAVSFVTINEISTAALAYTFSHFFSNAPTTDAVTNAHFGSPASLTPAISNVYGTLYTLLDVENGYPRLNTSTIKFEGSKLITVGNILGGCVNSIGPSATSCSSLFSNLTAPNGTHPTNTLEAAVDLALNPQQNVPVVFALQPRSGLAAFSGGLTSAPYDWSLSASYTTPTFALGVNTRTASTIDIDTAGRVWFPSNGSGKAGVGYFDPSSATFSPLFTAGLQHPDQVAIDVDNYVWVTDSASPNVAGFPASSPASPTTLTLPGSISTSVTVAYDNTLRFGIVAPDGLPALATVTGKNSYSEIAGSEVPGGGGFIASSLAGDVIGGVAIGGQELRTPTTYDMYDAPNGSITAVTYQTFQDAGQVVFNGSNFVGTRGGYSNPDDGICIWSARGCYAMANQAVRHPSGLALDGAGALWLADQVSPTIEQIPQTNGSYLNANNQANNLVFDHDASAGGTLPSPTGIAVDNIGNVWVSNYGCYGNGCTPGSFTLSEIIGLAAPTITPVSRQVVIDNLAGTQPKKTGTSGAK